MADPPQKRDPMAAAMEWVAKITTIGLEMCLPAVGGYYLDQRFQTSIFALLGIVLGSCVGFYHLLVMTGAVGKRKNNDSESEEEEKF